MLLDLKTVMKLRDYELLKKYLKKEIEQENYISIERLTKFIEILEDEPIKVTAKLYADGNLIEEMEEEINE